MNKFVGIKHKEEEDNGVFTQVNNNFGFSICVLVIVTMDFDINNSYKINSLMDSYQIRPKLIYKNSKGYYYNSKEKGYGAKTTRIYLDNKEVEYNIEMLKTKFKEECI